MTQYMFVQVIVLLYIGLIRIRNWVKLANLIALMVHRNDKLELVCAMSGD